MLGKRARRVLRGPTGLLDRPHDRRCTDAEPADEDVRAHIGEGTRIWHLAQVREDARIGRDCIIGRGAHIGPGVLVRPAYGVISSLI